MLVSHAWLREWVATDADARALADILTRGGLEVAAVDTAGPTLHAKRVVVGEIIRSCPHPQARHLKVCEVDAGRRARLTMVCGAANAVAGAKAPVAMAGAKLPRMEVRAKRIGGVESAGMLCSAEELGLAETSTGIMRLDDDAPPGRPVGEYLDLADPVLELELTPNRGDCLGILGIAREVSALTGAKMRRQYHDGPIRRPVKKVRARNRSQLPVELAAPGGCPRYVGRAVRNVDVSARTPDWMAERLRRCGVRGVNVVVDVTNYVMLELGQPMHAFDMAKLDGGIVVRMAKKREKLRLLDGGTVTLDGGNLVIADHRKAVALAGIMGGLDSAISETTRHIYFEAAYFPAAAIAGKARKLGMQTDASQRFERGVDAGLQADAMERASALLVSLAGGEPGPVSDARCRAFLPRPVKIRLEPSEIRRILGVPVPGNTVRALLGRLGMKTTPAGAAKARTKTGAKAGAKTTSGWDVRVPGWRFDITGRVDLVEEVGRVVGFDNIPPRPPHATATTGGHPESRVETARLKRALVERGYFEAITYSFVDPAVQQALLGGVHGGIELRNPIADNMAVMRRSLWPGLLEAVRVNLNRRHERVRLFEAGHVFLKGRKGKPEEIHRIGGAVTGPVLPKQWGAASREVDFFDIKGDVLALPGLAGRRMAVTGGAAVEFRPAAHPALHPGRSARITVDGKPLGYLGQLHPGHQKSVDIDRPVYLFELDLPALAQTQLPRFSPVSRHPAVRRDLAVVVDAGVGAQDVLDAARAAAGGLLVEVELFDIYAGGTLEKNRKSFAFRLTFQSESSNLTAGEADAETAKVVSALQRQLGARLRT